MKRLAIALLIAFMAISYLSTTAHADEALFGTIANDIKEAERIGGAKAMDAKLAQILRAAKLAFTDLQIVELIAYLIENGLSEEMISNAATEVGISREILSLAHQVAFEGLVLASTENSYEQLGSIYAFSDSAHVAGSKDCRYVSPWKWTCF